MSVKIIHEDGSIETALCEELLEINLKNNKNIKQYTLEEYFKSGISTGWHYNSLGEELEDFVSDKDRRIMEGTATKEDYNKDIKEGDIIMVTDYTSPSTGKRENDKHRFLIVREIKREEGKPNEYRGCELETSNNNPKSRSNVFNKHRDDYANNIYIGDFRSILDRGRSTEHNECYIDVGNICSFDDSGIEDTGYWKGHINDRFKDFISQCIVNALQGNKEANKEMQWPMKMKNENKLNEGSMSRLLQHANQGQLAFITGWGSTNSRKENSKANMDLSNDLQNAGLSFSKVKGGYVETTDTDGNKLDKPNEVEENTFAVYNNKFRPEDFKSFMISLCNKYNQESVLITDAIYKDEKGTLRYYNYRRGPKEYEPFISSKYYNGKGEIVARFNGLTINNVQQYYTKIFGKKFAFTENLDIPNENFTFTTNSHSKVAIASNNYNKVKFIK